MSGMLSLRYNGCNVPTIVGYNLGNIAKQVMRVFAVVLLVLVGVVFVAAPAGLLAKLTPDYMNTTFWIVVLTDPLSATLPTLAEGTLPRSS